MGFWEAYGGRRRRRCRWACIVLAVLAFASVGERSHAQQRPNVLLIMTDDQGYGDLGVHGNKVLQTPNLDALARESTELTHFYVNPNCSPTRASLMTGRWAFRTGVSGVHSTEHLMNAEEVTVAEMLSDAGYRTGIFGKWHLGDNYPMRPTDNGFQEALVHKGGGIGQAAGPPGNDYFDPILEHNNVSKRYEGYGDNVFADAAIDFISQDSSKPFFAYYATNLPHFPLQISDERADPYRKLGLHEYNARTYGMLANIDANVGRLLSTLDERGIAENTIVIFLSDNGPRTRRTKNDVYPGRYVAGLRGTKTSIYENGIRVPFFVRWPGHIPGGEKINAMAAHVDVLPTILEAARVDRPPQVDLDGLSLMPLLRDEVDALPERELYFQWHNGPEPYPYLNFAVRSENYKLVQSIQNPHDIIRQPTDEELREQLSSLELYDIRSDSSELNDVASKQPEKVEALLAAYEKWFREVTEEGDFDDPQRIHVGTEFQPKTTLSRFDWSGPRVISDNQLGHWKVHTEAGPYRITLRFDEASGQGTARVRYGELMRQHPVQRGDTLSVFENITLPEGVGKLEAFLELDRLPTGVRYVDVEKRK